MPARLMTDYANGQELFVGRPVARILLCLIGMLTLVAVAPAHAQDIKRSDLCNQGTATLYFTTVGENTGLLSAGAMTQGFSAVPPDSCVEIVPYGMSRVILTFFKKDSRGLMTNLRIQPQNTDGESADYQLVCVNPTKPWRIFGTTGDIFSRFVNADCPAGFSPAIPSWIHTPGGLSTYNISVDSNSAAVAWQDRQQRTYQQLPAIRQSQMQTDNVLVQTNPYAERSHEQAKVLFGAIDDWLQRSQAEAQQRRAQAWEQQRRRRQQFENEVDKAEQSLETPDDAACAPYMEKDRYTRDEDVALSGVKLKMALMDAHRALVCNGFSADPQAIAKAGGVERFWANTREKVFRKQLENGATLFTDVETRPPRGAPKGADYVVLTVRIRYRPPQLISDDEWSAIRADFKRKYDVGRKRAENQLAIHRRIKIDGEQHALKLDAQAYRPGQRTSYSITML
ncbi:hypothetical protein [Woeseia oceani]|nr:hypothetical protein [Woeseia oceani]